MALKIPDPFLNRSEESELLEEIRLSSRLEHPNILRIRNADKVNDLYVIASELAVESLEGRLGRRLGTRLALSYAEQILQGLAYAHANRVIHRDLKPSNLMIYSGGRLRIADFGLAKVVKHSMVSATGSGTLLYIAPEQAHGYPCFASDVFSVGLICHQMFTGKLPRWPFEWPFAGTEVLESKVPVEFVRLIRKATHFRHELRYHDAGEMLQAFRRIEPSLRKFLAPRPKTRRRRLRLGIWRDIRFREFQRAFGKRLFLRFRCPDCRGPLSEHMLCCPWCGVRGVRFDEITDFTHYCERCGHGLKDEWRYCPWCWGAGFTNASGMVRPDARYSDLCRSCDGPLIHGMRYCPWCHAKCSQPVRVDALPDLCSRCKSSVPFDFWDYCPWCTHNLRKPTTRRQ